MLRIRNWPLRVYMHISNTTCCKTEFSESPSYVLRAQVLLDSETLTVGSPIGTAAQLAVKSSEMSE